MKNWFTLLLIGLSMNLNAQGIDNMVEYFVKADVLFSENVSEGLVEYTGIKNNPEQLNHLLKFMETVDLTGEAVSVKKAFWINSYNLWVIKSVVNKYPITSPMDDRGFFKRDKHLIAGKEYTLDDIEKQVLKRIDNNDPRLHFVLVCAAIGCPKLASFSYNSAGLNQQMEEQTRIILNDPDFIKVDNINQTAQLSELFKWYKADFEKNGRDVLAYINLYREEKIPADYKISTYKYDWSLNEKKK